MAIQIKLKNSVVQDSTPSTSDLPAVGEIALNANINSIGGFMRASNNTIVKIFGPGSVTTPTATTTVSGISELATNSETTTGTATNRVVTPAGLNAVTVAERTTSNTNYVAKAGSTMTGVLTAIAGSNSGPSINFGDSDSGIFGGTNSVSLTAGGTTRLTADTGVSITGALGVTGNISNSGQITCGVTGTSGIQLINDGTFGTLHSADLVLRTHSTERARLDTSGRLLVGLTSSRAIANITTLQQIEGTDAASGLSITRNSANNVGGSLNFGKTRGSALGATTIVQDGDMLGQIRFSGSDGNDLTNHAASIIAHIDGTPGNNDTPGRLVFSTTADGNSDPTERLRIDSAGLVKLPDNGKFVAGAGSDLQIYHDGSKSLIDNSSGVGNLLLYGNGTNSVVIQPVAGENSIVANSNSSVELFFDNTKRFETTAGGAIVTGTLDTTDTISSGNSNIKIDGDTGKFLAGASNDLQIYHDGSNSAIQNSTGYLYLYGGTNNIYIRPKNDEDAIVAKPNGAVELYHNNVKKFETTANGADFTVPSSGQVNIFGSGGTNGLRISGPQSASSACLFFNTNHNNVSGGTDQYTIQCGGANHTLMFKHTDTTGNVVFELDDTEHVRIPQDSKALKIGAGQDLRLLHDGNNSFIQNDTGNLVIAANRGGDVGGQIWIDAINGERSARFYANAQAELFYDGTKKFETTSAGVKIDAGLLEIAHTSCHIDFMETSATNHRLRNGSGNFHIQRISDDKNTTTTQFLVDGGTGAVELYHNGTKMFETTSDGATLQKGLTVRGVEGAEAQIRIEADEADNATDRFRLLATDSAGFHIQSYDGSQYDTLFKGVMNGAVELYFNNSKKFETDADGAEVIGNRLRLSDNVKVACGAGGDLEIFHDGTNNIINDAGSTKIKIQRGGSDVWELKSTGLQGIDNQKLMLGTSDDLQIFHDGTNSRISNTTGKLLIKDDIIEFVRQADDTVSFVVNEGGSTELYHNHVKKLSTTANGICFNSDTAAPNALDDYEEGSWTATAQYGDNTNHNLANVVCRYTKIGSLVHISGRFTLNTHTGSGGELRIGGLPFAKGNPSGDGNSDGICVYVEGAKTAITNSISGLVLDGDTQFLVRKSGTTGSGNDMSASTDSGTTLLVGGTYTLVA